MYIMNEPSFFLTNKTEAPQGEELGLMKPLLKSSCSCFDNSFILDGAKRYGARAQVKLLELDRSGGRPGKILRKHFRKVLDDRELNAVDTKLLSAPSLTLPSTPTLNPGESSGVPMRRYLREAHDPDFVLEPVYPEYITLEDEHVLPAEEQPLPHDGPVDYPMGEGDDGGDDDGDSSRDDAADEDEDMEEEEEDEEEEEEEEHIASVDSTAVIPVVELVSSPEGTKPVLRPPFIDITTTRARISVRLQAFVSLPSTVDIERLIALPTPPLSPLTSLSPPFAGERLARLMDPSVHPSPLLLPSSGCLTQTQTLRITSTQALTDAVTAALPSSSVDRKDEIPESKRPPRKRSCLFAIGSRYEAGESSTTRTTGGQGTDYGFVSTVDFEVRRKGIRDVGYGIRDTWIDPAEAVLTLTPTTVEEVNTRVVELAELHEHDIQDFHALLEDAQDVWTVNEEAYVARVAWNHSIGLSQATYQELQTHRDHVDMRREMSDMQKELISQREQLRRERQPGPDARFPDHQETPPPTNPNNITPEAVQTMIDQALLRNSGGGDESHSSHTENPRNMHIERLATTLIS
uniref:Uncharacterized protein n=1 Tax=Tanacetum cinerariifolium TaxID=118510 RepID=A0A699J9T2_TANCI|nr:hypothetical protein [Tanacetum cinerariifolium]